MEGSGGRHKGTTLPPWQKEDSPIMVFPDEGRDGDASYRPEHSTFDYNNFLTPVTITPHIDGKLFKVFSHTNSEIM